MSSEKVIQLCDDQSLNIFYRIYSDLYLLFTKTTIYYLYLFYYYYFFNNKRFGGLKASPTLHLYLSLRQLKGTFDMVAVIYGVTSYSFILLFN